MIAKRLLLGVVVVFLSVGAVARANITYQLLNVPSQQNEWTLSGTITTNGTLGALYASDIIAWDWTVQKSGMLNDGYASVTPGASLTLNGSLVATETSIYLPVPPESHDHVGLQLFGGGPQATPSILWDSYDTAEHGRSPMFVRSCVGTGTTYFSTYMFRPSSPLTIAVIPEPSSLGLLLLGGTALLRRRR